MNISTRRFAKSSITRGGHGWGGDNITSDPLGFDTGGGEAFGLGEFGGIRHFLNRTKVVISHK